MLDACFGVGPLVKGQNLFGLKETFLIIRVKTQRETFYSGVWASDADCLFLRKIREQFEQSFDNTAGVSGKIVRKKEMLVLSVTVCNSHKKGTWPVRPRKCSEKTSSRHTCQLPLLVKQPINP